MGQPGSKENCCWCCGGLVPSHRRVHELRLGPEVAGHLTYPVSQGDLDTASFLIGKIHDGNSVNSVLRAKWPECKEPRWDAPQGSQEARKRKRLVVIYTDLEPDDCMAIAQLWQWRSENDDMDGEPLIIFQVDTVSKDGGTILETKQLMLSLMVGLTDDRCKILTEDGDYGNGLSERTGRVHPQARALAQARGANIESIANQLASYDGDYVDLYIMAPGHGNLGAILDRLQTTNRWPLKATWRVTMYTGSYNMRGMTDSDIRALQDIMKCTKGAPLVDVGKHPFFGGKDCHDWTDSLTTFAHPGFATRLYEESPLLAAVLVFFNDEFNQGLIDPQSKSLFKGSSLEDSEKARFQELAAIYKSGDVESVQKYAKALVEDQGLFAKVAGFKKSTLKAYAYGGCDSPLCDQLVFLYEWLRQHHPSFLRMERGGWVFDKEKGFTTLDEQGPGLFPAERPVLLEPRNEVTLMKMRRVLVDYVIRHLKAVECRVERQAGNLKYGLDDSKVADAKHVIDRLHKRHCNLQQATRELVPQWQEAPPRAENSSESELLFVYTDLEPDDVMATAQLSQWSQRHSRETAKTQPLIVFHANFESKDGATVFEKKRLMAALMLSDLTEHILTRSGDEGNHKYERDGLVHPAQEEVVKAREATLDSICNRLKNVTQVIELNLLAPCYGNLADIVKRLKDKKLWPLKAKWRVSMYSGSFNMRGMLPADLEALEEIMAHSGEGDRLVDIAKFKFFGGKGCHPWTDSLATFVMPTFAKQLSRRWPELAALLKLFNDEFNEGLIDPKSKSLFKEGALEDQHLKARFEKIKVNYKPGDGKSLCKYAKDMVEDEVVFAKVRDFKKSTFRSFAYGGCDAPLCDQLVYLYKWLRHNKQDYLDTKEEEVGAWFLDREKGFTTIKKEGPGIRAVQPALANPLNESELLDMRIQLESQLLKHLNSLSWGSREAYDACTNTSSFSEG